MPCRVRRLVLFAGCLIISQLTLLRWLWTGAQESELASRRSPGGTSVPSPSRASAVLLAPRAPGDAVNFVVQVARALRNDGRYEVQILGAVAAEPGAQVCGALEHLEKEHLEFKDSLPNFIVANCNIGRPKVFMLFGDSWAPALAQHRKHSSGGNGSLLWFVYPSDPCTARAEAVMPMAFAAADHVIFLKDERAKYQLPSSKVHVFRPIVDVTPSTAGLTTSHFTVTLETASCCDPEYGQIAAAMWRTFDASWSLVVYRPCPISEEHFLPSNVVMTYQKDDFYQRMQGANLHVSLDVAGPSWSSIYASALGVPSVVASAEQLSRPGIDGYHLPGASAALPAFLAALNRSALPELGAAAQAAQQLRFSAKAGQTRMQFFMEQLQARSNRKTRIAMFLQMHNASLWWSLYPCMENVLLAAEPQRSVDLFVITTSEDSAAQLKTLAGSLRRFAALRYVVVALGANKGADIGLFLQQLLMNVEMQLDVDIIFKLHSKRKELWRSLLVNSLCGSVEVVRRNVEAMENNSKIGIIGPSKLTWGPDSQSFIELKLKKKGYNEVALQGMNATWAVLDTGTPFPHRKHWIICAGSFFWLSTAHWSIWQQLVVPAVPRVLALSGNYSTGCDKKGIITCLLAVGFERILPTLIKASGGQVVDAETLRSPK